MGLCISKTPTPPPSLTTSITPPPLDIRAPSLPTWPDLAPDLVGLILCRLTCHADRLSFAAVCRDWRLASQEQHKLRGAMPWLNLGLDVYQSLLDGKVHHFNCHGSSGCWIIYYHDQVDTPGGGGGRCLFLRNPFHASSASIEILWPCREPSKIVLCSVKSIAAILHRGVCIIAPFYLADMSRPPAQQPWFPLIGNFTDMEYFCGKIFTVTHLGELISHDLFSRRRENVIRSSMACDKPADNTLCHLVASAGKDKLMMVRWSIPSQQTNGDHRWAMDLHVFEADLAKGHWSELQDLGGESLFISKSCSKAFGSTDRCHPRFTQGNRVYILGVDWHLKMIIAGVGMCSCPDCCDQQVAGGIVPSYCVYDMITRTVDLVSLGGGHDLKCAMSEWFFPCE